MSQDKYRPYTKENTEKIVRIGRELRDGTRTFPPKIIALIHEIEDKTYNAQLFLKKLRKTDFGMINEIVRLMHKKDQMIEDWLDSEK